jgi:hypothetical protein
MGMNFKAGEEAMAPLADRPLTRGAILIRVLTGAMRWRGWRLSTRSRRIIQMSTPLEMSRRRDVCPRYVRAQVDES